MRALVCGGRNFSDYEKLEKELLAFEQRRGRFGLIIHGGARGADSLAGMFAHKHKIPIQVFPADWNKYGRGAGPIRNKQMLIEGKPDIIIAFLGGRGTANMINQAIGNFEVITIQC